MKNIIFIKKKIDFINTKSNKKIVQLYFIKNFFYRKLIFNKISFILKKNPYTKFSKKKYNISLIYFKDSKKIRKNILPIKEQNLNNNNYKITIYTGWSLISNLYFFYSHSNNELFLKKRKVEKFFYSKNVSSEILFLFFNFYYFNIFKFLKNRKFIKNNKFFLTLDNTIISRNRLIKTNLKKGNTIINNYKKIHEKRLNCKLKRKNIFKILFDKKKYYKNFNILNSFQNQQQKYKIKTNFVFFSIEKNNLINFNNLKIISHIFILKFNANNYFQNNQIDIIYKFPQQISFYKKKRIREKNFLHIKKNLKIRKKKILENSIFYRYSICSPVYGEITKIQNSFLGKQKTIFLSKNEKKTYISENLSKNFFMGKVIRIGDPLNSLYVSKVNGQIIQKTKKYITIRKAHPYLFSTQSIFHMKNTDFVKKNNLLMTLFYQKLKNEDIIQGIPKIEELFEARNLKTLEKKKDNIHLKLELCFQKYKKLYSLEKALQKSIKTIQQVLVHNIQKVYQEQGVFIADKHVEIIVRQMTTKIFITESGKSGLLQGELIDIKYIELINLGNNFKQIHYQPIILGITKASLETESFISAASFQETTRILSNGVIEQKTDFLRGLKENVIVGHLIPAGTGYKVFSL
jgi:DNA-directed RNA polymerase subunit beta'